MTTDLPPGWELARLGDLVITKSGNSKLIKGKLFAAAQPGLIPAYSASGQDVWCEEAEWEVDGVVLSAVGARCGKTFLARGQWTAIANTHVLIPVEGIDPLWLWYLTNDEDFWVKGGSAQPFVKMKLSKEVSVSVPPIAEQKRIVAVIEEHCSRLDAVDAALGDASRRLGVLRNNMLDRAFYDDAADMQEVQIADVAEVSGGIQKQPKRRPRENRYPFLRVANVGRGQLDLAEVHEIELFEGEIERFMLRSGDMLVVEGNGSVNQIGRAALWSGEIDDCVHQNHLIRVRPGDELLPEYLELCWNAPRTARQVREVASSTSGLYTLSTSKVKSVRIPVTPLQQQQEVVERLESHLRTIEAAQVAAADAGTRVSVVRRAVLARAFAGQLVLHNPVHEPASELPNQAAATSAI